MMTIDDREVGDRRRMTSCLEGLTDFDDDDDDF